MSSSSEPVIRVAGLGDVAAICWFGNTHIRSHYLPLIGAAAAEDQVRNWWNTTVIATAVADGLVVVAVTAGQIVGVAQRGRDQVVYKLYLDPAFRGRGLGVRLLDAVIAQLPDGAERLGIEHFAANTRAGAFYEREGFTIDRVEPSASGNPALDVVWRSRPLR